ncbi:MAG: CapA family protein [Stomatobaculum sp.]|nr:CapA family protein [Stomatobaculum sp.]
MIKTFSGRLTARAFRNAVFLLAAFFLLAPAFLPGEACSGTAYAARIAGRGAGSVNGANGPAANTAGAESTGDAGDTFTIAVAGDILFDPVYTAGLKATSRGVAGSFDEKALETMRGADVFIVNNEFTYTRGGKRSGKTYAFRTDPKYAAMLQEMGVDLVTLANNHTWDFGEQGFLDTLSTLDSIGMPYIGGGRNLAEAMQPAVFEAGNMKIAVLNATEIERTKVWTKAADEQSPGVFRCFDPALLLDAVRAAKAENDAVVVILHWGIEGQSRPDARQKEMARLLKEAGADLIVGGHPHVLQSVGFAENVPVAYSMGNFLFHSGVHDTGILEAEFDTAEKKLKSLRFVPMQSRDCRVVLLEGREKEQFVIRLRRISPEAEIDEEGFIRLPQAEKPQE